MLHLRRLQMGADAELELGGRLSGGEWLSLGAGSQTRILGNASVSRLNLADRSHFDCSGSLAASSVNLAPESRFQVADQDAAVEAPSCSFQVSETRRSIQGTSKIVIRYAI